jgi:transposase-like protein
MVDRLNNKNLFIRKGIFMSRKSKFSGEEKYKILIEYKNSNLTISEISIKYNISKYTFEMWQDKYNRNGITGLKNKRTNKSYSKEFKEKIVIEYLSGGISQKDLVIKYNLSDKSLVRRWVKRYNSHRGLKSSGKGMKKSMTKGRKTTWKERIDIVLFCLKNDFDYTKAAEKYEVSYQQVYLWVKKYKDHGVDALKDRRGRKKSEEELTEQDKLKIKMKEIEAENERLKAENAFLKKLEELERRRS